MLPDVFIVQEAGPAAAVGIPRFEHVVLLLLRDLRVVIIIMIVPVIPLFLAPVM
jgi:hypothetical protein